MPDDFDIQEQAVKITPMWLVKYYYKLLSRTFDGTYTSRNEIVETSVLKKIMAKNGDSLEDTKLMIEFLIGRARARNRFEEVSTMGLYGSKRNAIHRAVFKNANTIDSPMAKPIVANEEGLLENMSELLDFYIGDGMNRDEAIDKLKVAFGDELLNKFLGAKCEK